jgi:hypothetical protein
MIMEASNDSMNAIGDAAQTLREPRSSCGSPDDPQGLPADAVSTRRDSRYVPRAILEVANLFLLGHNVYAIKRERSPARTSPGESALAS